MIYEIIFALGLIFTWAWVYVTMLDNKVTNDKIDQMCKDLWDTMACKVNHTDYDAKEYMDLHHRDVLYTSHAAIRQDFEKSVRNISILAANLGYVWSVTDTKGKSVLGHWAKVSTKKNKVSVKK